MHHLSLLASLVASSMIAGVNSALIKVQVGKNSTGQLDTVFNPNQVTAQVGDMIQFEFMAKNHTATQSSFAQPCTRQLNTALNLAGASSGFMPVAANATQIPTFTIQVNDASSPQWFFCNQANHCNLGMVFSINAPTSGNKTFAAFLANAKTATHPDPALNQTAPFTPPAAPAAASPPPSSSGSTSPSSTSSPSNSTSPDTSSNSTSIAGRAPSPTDVPANVAPGVASSSSVTYAGLSLSLANGSASISSPAPSGTGTGTAAQDQGGASSTLSGTAFIPGATTSRSSAGSSLRLSVAGLRVGGGKGLGVFVGLVLGVMVL